ncbi:MAG: hypothetical protein AB7F43_08800 [Bacteriovoracia bacterium]
MALKPLKRKTLERFILGGVFVFLSLSAYELLFSVSPASSEASRHIASENKIEKQSSGLREKFLTYNLPCEAPNQHETTATKIRISGPLCSGNKPIRRPALTEKERLTAKAENATNKYIATVFYDQIDDRYSTEFIPLEPGANQILIRLSRSHKSYTKSLTFIRK